MDNRPVLLVKAKLRIPGLKMLCFVHYCMKLLLPFEQSLSSSSTLFGAKAQDRAITWA
jgi:hypothetical protein